MNYRATSDKFATSSTPPTRCKLPATRTFTGQVLSHNFLTWLIACSIEGNTWICSFGYSGTREDHAVASLFCVVKFMNSSLDMALVVKSGRLRFRESPL